MEANCSPAYFFLLGSPNFIGHGDLMTDNFVNHYAKRIPS